MGVKRILYLIHFLGHIEPQCYVEPQSFYGKPQSCVEPQSYVELSGTQEECPRL